MFTSLLTRRRFLQTLAVGGMAAAAHLIPLNPLLADTMLPTPPALMLHSRHHHHLPQILQRLVSEGFEGITYLDIQRALHGEIVLPLNPVLITIDDLCPVRGNPSFGHFAAMAEALISHHFKGTFALITRPRNDPDEAWWAQVASWQAHGIEVETHTSFHSNLDNAAFTYADYQAEIVASAELIRQRTGYGVRALVTPYGSGFDRGTGQIHPLVAQASREAGLQFVIGIVDGRAPIPMYPSASDLHYLGRVGADDACNLDRMVHWLTHWAV